MQFIADYISNRATARNLRQKSKILNVQAKGVETAARSNAAQIRRAAGYNHEIAGRNLRAAASNKTRLLGSIRVKQADSGFANTGSQQNIERDAASILNEHMAVMAESASLAYLNSHNQAIATERQGTLAAANLRAQASSYASTARHIGRAANLQLGISSLSTAAAFALTGGKGLSMQTRIANAFNLGDTTSGLIGSASPYSSSSVTDWGRNTLGYIAGAAGGNYWMQAPYFS